MEGMEDKLNAILGNPQMMQQIMAMAQAMGQQNEEPKPEPPPQQSSAPGLDMAMIQKLGNIARQSGIDKNQQNLLRALSPYLSRERIVKLEKAMRAAKIAGIASTALAGSGITFLSGR
ncbi:MAG: hypothetical protein IJO72_01605 [Oscillospiraceae bacterium]|nr:hypothetical protein [Oscillospiraceae bacterium]